MVTKEVPLTLGRLTLAHTKAALEPVLTIPVQRSH